MSRSLVRVRAFRRPSLSSRTPGCGFWSLSIWAVHDLPGCPIWNVHLDFAITNRDKATTNGARAPRGPEPTRDEHTDLP
jgi:hypothetical protein